MQSSTKDHFSVFVAEDEQPAIDYLLKLILSREELKIEGWAKDGKDALQKLYRKNYDLLFLDINLPVISGIEILERLKSYPRVIIITTAYTDYKEKAVNLGAVDYLLKPFSEDRFNSAVDKAINLIKLY